MKAFHFSNLKNDLAGGLTAGLIPFPRAMALGALVFAPLGPEYVSFGIVAGLLAMACSNLGAAATGSVPIMNNAPFSLSTFMLLSVLELLIVRLGEGYDPQTVIALLFLTVFFSGVIQILFGVLHLGNLAKYIPYPVLSGLLNGAAILIALSQIHVFLGLPQSVKWWDFSNSLGAIQVPSVIVGLSVCLAMWFGPGLSKRIPSPLYGIAAGVAVYYLLLVSGFEEKLGPVIGTIPAGIPLPRYLISFWEFFSSSESHSLISELLVFALGIAAINTLRSLVVTSATEALTQNRYNANRELIGQGTGNMLAGVFGGISAAGSLSSTFTNYHAGGRSPLSRVSSGLFPLLVLFLLHPLVAEIPKVVLAGMLIMIAIDSVDKWSIGLVRMLRPSLSNGDTGPLIDLILVVIVTVIMLTFGIFEALGIGVIIAVGHFVVRMGQSPIRRELLGDGFHSTTQRREEELILLERHGTRIRLLELQGSLFFGTADKIAEHIEHLLKLKAGFIVLDFRRITDIDSTGARIILQLMNKCLKKEVQIYLCGLILTPGVNTHRELVRSLPDEILDTRIFDEAAEGMSVAEDRLLDGILSPDRYDREIPMSEVDALQGLKADDIEVLQPFFTRMTFERDQAVFLQGEEGDSAYFIVSGRARVTLSLGGKRYKQLGTLCPGTVFGEMSIIDHQPRSADVYAENTLVCYRLLWSDMQGIQQQHPALAFHILTGLSKELSNRIRSSNQTRVDTTIYRGMTNN